MKKRNTFLLVLLFIPLAALLVFWLMLDRTPPAVTLQPEQGFVSTRTSFSLLVQDKDSGLRQVVVKALQGDTSVPLLTKTFDSTAPSFSETFTLEGTSLQEGEFTIAVQAVDGSQNNWTRGNDLTTTKNLVFDSTPPSISVLCATRYVYQGGAASVAYTLTEESPKTGVTVGDTFYPGYEHSPGQYLCFYAYPHSIEDTGTTPTLVAEDEADNLAQIGVPVYVKERSFRRDKLNISDRFLKLKMPQFTDGANQDTTHLFQTFLRVNKEVRIQNSQKIQEIGNRSSAELMWDGVFLRLPNSARRAGYGDHRSYFYDGKPVDEAYHLGIDLASIARSPIPAANGGRVVFADTLGIYGQTVILDHGFGVQSLYSHLSEIDVGVGEPVKKGQTIGLTGETGMALGDHLHFGMLVSGTPVTPVEWWDFKWIQDRIAPCLESLSGKK